MSKEDRKCRTCGVRHGMTCLHENRVFRICGSERSKDGNCGPKGKNWVPKNG